MSKAVLISIRPEWCEKIALYQKTIEIRKMRPKIEEPFKCYIYCTKDNPIMGRNLWLNDDGSVRYNAFGKCKEEDFDRYNQDHLFRANGMVIGEFVCDRIIKALPGDYHVFLPKRLTALYPHELSDYADGKTLYGWHISDLVIYDKPRELREFFCRKPLEHPPMSWCYVEEVK